MAEKKSILGHRRGKHLDAREVLNSGLLATNLRKHLLLIHHCFQFPLVCLTVGVVLLVSTFVNLRTLIYNYMGSLD